MPDTQNVFKPSTPGQISYPAYVEFFSRESKSVVLKVLADMKRDEQEQQNEIDIDVPPAPAVPSVQ